MKNLTAVMGFTLKDAVRKKSFLISNAIFILVIVVLFNIPNLMGLFSGSAAPEPGVQGEKPGEISIVFTGEQDLLTDRQLTAFPNSAVERDADLAALQGRISSGGLDGVVVLARAGRGLTYDYYWTGSDESAAISEFLTAAQNSVLLAAAGVEVSTAAAIQTGVKVNAMTDLTPEGSSGTMGIGAILPMVCSFLLFFAIYFYGYCVSTSISSEKTSRVMETLITSTSPTAIVLGKTFANGLLGLGQVLLLLLTGVVSYHLFLPEKLQIMGLLLGEGGTSVGAVLVILVYFILGYLVYAMLNAVTGATVSKAEDINSANMPISLLSILSFYLAYLSSMMPGAPINVAASLIPFSSPFTMPGRILAGGVPGWQIALSIVILLATSAFIAYLSIRIYSALILHYGNRLKCKDLFLAYKNR